MDGLSSAEAYRVVLRGDDVEHLRALLDPDAEFYNQPSANCPACQRIRKAAALAEFVELDPERSAA